MLSDMKEQIENIFMKVVRSNIILLVVFTIFAVVFSELLVHLQLSTFWQDRENHDMAYHIGFWTPLIDAFFIVFLVISIKNIYEKNLEEKEEELRELNKSLELRVKEAVEQNRIKDQQLLLQSRLAQMGEMISMIAHQWRQPLGAISATVINLELAIELEEYDLETKKGIEKYNKHFLQRLENINGFVHDLTVTIDDFRNFYKGNKKAVNIELDEVVSKSLKIINSSLINDKIKLIQEHNSNKKIYVYDHELMQVILNILKNAQDNFKEKETKNPQIIITIQNKSISICDNGGGIPEDMIDNIFDPYFSTKDEKNGSGLGLYMSKMIVEEHHNGKLSVENRADGVCFIIELGVLS